MRQTPKERIVFRKESRQAGQNMHPGLFSSSYRKEKVGIRIRENTKIEDVFLIEIFLFV